MTSFLSIYVKSRSHVQKSQWLPTKWRTEKVNEYFKRKWRNWNIIFAHWLWNTMDAIGGRALTSLFLHPPPPAICIDLKIDNNNIPQHTTREQFFVEKKLKWSQIGKYWQNIHCSTCLLLKFHSNEPNTVQIAQIQLRMNYRTPCSDVRGGSKNRMCAIKSGHDFCGQRNSIRFQTMAIWRSITYVQYLLRTTQYISTI